VVATHELSADEPQPPGALGKAAGAGSTGAHTVINGLFCKCTMLQDCEPSSSKSFPSLNHKRHCTCRELLQCRSGR
jgi:hypothetical protein